MLLSQIDINIKKHLMCDIAVRFSVSSVQQTFTAFRFTNFLKNEL